MRLWKMWRIPCGGARERFTDWWRLEVRRGPRLTALVRAPRLAADRQKGRGEPHRIWWLHAAMCLVGLRPGERC